MRRTAILIGLATVTMAVGTSSARARASRKAATVEAQYQANFTAVWAALNAVTGSMAALQPIVTAGNASYLAGLSVLPHQTTGNLTASKDTSTSDGWQTGGRGSFNASVDILNGLVNAVNGLQQHLQNNNFEA